MRVTKMHALGNDYVYHLPDAELDWPAVSEKISDRHFGIGSDGLVLGLPSAVADMRMRVFNADGSEAEISGNGLRCLVKFALEEGFVRDSNDDVTVETLAGIKRVTVLREGGVVTAARINMSAPSFDPGSLPADVAGAGPVIDLPLAIGGVDLKLTLVSVGNPHAVHYVDANIDEFPLERIGAMVEHHRLFPRRVNFQVVQVLDRAHVKHRIWERGSGVTLSSGTSASAVCAAARLRGMTDERIIASQPGGDLILDWDGDGSIFLTGPATRVFDAEWSPT